MVKERTKEGKLLTVQEYLSIRVNLRRAREIEQCKGLGIVNAWRIGKAVYYIHNGAADESGNITQLKYVLVRPDLCFCESGAFDYVPGWDIREFISDNYLAHDFNEF